MAKEIDVHELITHRRYREPFGAARLTIKLIFETSTGRILGAQAVGEGGGDKRIDVPAMAIQMGAMVFDLEQAELCYPPQYGSAKDAVNLVGFQGANVLRGSTMPIMPIELQVALETATPPVIVNVRSSAEFKIGHIPGFSLPGITHEGGRVADRSVRCHLSVRSVNEGISPSDCCGTQV